MPKVLTNKIRVLRFHHNEMTQQALANAVNVSRQTVVAIEKGKYSPSLEVAFKIADVFGISIADVFNYEAE
jgi:putative transcriptional regulator